jgi:hypothetical protein
MGESNKYIPSNSYLVDYAVQLYGAEIISVQKKLPAGPPFHCLTGVSDTSDRFRIDKVRYPNIVAAGVDTLELNFGIEEYKESDMFERLNVAKEEAIAAGYKGRLGVPVELYGNEFMVQARGSKGGYEYLLKNGDVDLQIMPDARGGKPSPELRVVFRSPFLWQSGEVQAYNKVVEFVNNMASTTYCRVSRADLCVDKVMPLPEINRKAQVVSLMREKDLFYGGDFQRGQRETGYQFGRGGMSCRFYDKEYEIAVKGHGHIKQVWIENGWDGESPVSRLELQLRREGLRRFDATMDFVTFQDSKSDIWAYMTNKYIRIVNPESATRKERAKVIEYWKDYQSCDGLFGERQGVLPFKQISSDWRHLVKQATGCLASTWARLAADVGDANATLILEKEWEYKIPEKVIEAGLMQKARFGHVS